MKSLTQRSTYSDEVLCDAVNQVLAGASTAAVSSSPVVPYSTTRKWVVLVQSGVHRKPQRRGPFPLPLAEAESNLYDWIVGHQQVRFLLSVRKSFEKLQQCQIVYAIKVRATASTGALCNGIHHWQLVHLSLSERQEMQLTRMTFTLCSTRLLRWWLKSILMNHKYLMLMKLHFNRERKASRS